MQCECILPFKFNFDQLREMTDDFSKENFLGNFQFGEVYRGKMKWGLEVKDVLVKTWEEPEIYNYFPGDNEIRWSDELVMFQNENLICHPGMIKLFGYLNDHDYTGAVYDFKPLDTVHNLIPRDNFTWLQRIKVAFGFASLLKFLHTRTQRYKPFTLRNISAAHIVVDEEYNPKLFDIGMITGGIFPDRTKTGIFAIFGCYGYIDDCFTGEWNNKTDVYSFGVLLLNLITKKVYTEEDRENNAQLPSDWAWSQYNPESDCGTKTRILVHQSLTADSDYCPTDGRKLTKLAMKCMDCDPDERPDMKKIINCMLKLQAVKNHADYLGEEMLLHARAKKNFL